LLLNKKKNIMTEIQKVAHSKDESVHIDSTDQLPGTLSFNLMASIKTAAIGAGKALGGAVASKMGGGASSALGNGAKSLAASGMKPVSAGEKGGSSPAGFAKKMMAKVTSSLGGSTEKGTPAGLLGKLGAGLSGKVGGGQTGKQGTAVGGKPGGGEGAGSGSGGGGIVHTVFSKASSALGAEEGTEPTAGILNGLAGKLIDKAHGNSTIAALMNKLGGPDAVKGGVKGLISKLDTGKITGKISEQFDKAKDKVIEKAKGTKLGPLIKKIVPDTKVPPAVSTALPVEAAEKKPPAMGEAAFPDVEEMDTPTDLNQGNVYLKIQTTLGKDKVVLAEFSATERISDIYECTAVMVTDRNNLDLSKLIGKPVTVSMEFESDEEPEATDEKRTSSLTKLTGILDRLRKTATPSKSLIATSPKTGSSTGQFPGTLSFNLMSSIKTAAIGAGKVLGGAVASKMGGGVKSAMGDKPNSLAASGMKPLASGEKGGSSPAGFAKKMMAKITSSLGGSTEKGTPAGIMGKLGAGLSGLVGGGQTGKQGTGVGAKPGGGEGAGSGSGGGGIMSTLFKKASGALGADPETEPTAGILNGLSGKLIDKAYGNSTIAGLMDRVGGPDAIKGGIKALIGKLDTGKITGKITDYVEGTPEKKGLIDKAKEAILGVFTKKKPLDTAIKAEAKAEDKGPAEKRPAFGGEGFPKDSLVQRDLFKKIRYFNGIIGEIIQGPTDLSESSVTAYTVKFYPKLWLLKYAKTCRIFQKMTAMEIIQTVLKENNITDVTDKTRSAGRAVREYCVQYNESHFDFISRLMEFEGIFYYFIHTEDAHVMVLADEKEAHHQCPHTRNANMETKPLGQSYFNSVQSANLVSRVVPGEHALTDYDFELPSNNLFSKIEGRGYGGRIYEYPGAYNNKPDGQDFARLRIEADELPKDMLYGLATIPYFEPGAFFNLQDHVRSDANKKYVLLQIDHYATQQAEASDESFYNNKFLAFDHADGTYRPPLKTPSPRIHGTQTAKVTGPVDEEIWTDEYGRVKVKFHWDLTKEEDENTSCWVRVSQGWSGNGWGMLFTPRIGHEVVVTFLNGDPDQPLITGSVYNGEKRPPYLPDSPTMSTIKSNSTKDDVAGYNEISFQDLVDEEEIHIHAEKDFTAEINNDRNETINRGNYTQTIKTGSRTVTLMGDEAPKTRRPVSTLITGTGDDTLILEKGSRTEHLKGVGKGPGNYTTTIDKGDRNVTITKGNENITISEGNRVITVAKGDENRTITGNFTQKVTLNYVLDVDGNLDINVKGDIKINGKNITFTAMPPAEPPPEEAPPEEAAGGGALGGLGGGVLGGIAAAAGGKVMEMAGIAPAEGAGGGATSGAPAAAGSKVTSLLGGGSKAGAGGGALGGAAAAAGSKVMSMFGGGSKEHEGGSATGGAAAAAGSKVMSMLGGGAKDGAGGGATGGAAAAASAVGGKLKSLFSGGAKDGAGGGATGGAAGAATAVGGKLSSLFGGGAKDGAGGGATGGAAAVGGKLTSLLGGGSKAAGAGGAASALGGLAGGGGAAGAAGALADLAGGAGGLGGLAGLAGGEEGGAEEKGPVGEIKFKSMIYDVDAETTANLKSMDISADASVNMKTKGGASNSVESSAKVTVKAGATATISAGSIKIG
jgi:type VI secretion system secreted protein VgrG